MQMVNMAIPGSLTYPFCTHSYIDKSYLNMPDFLIKIHALFPEMLMNNKESEKKIWIHPLLRICTKS